MLLILREDLHATSLIAFDVRNRDEVDNVRNTCTRHHHQLVIHRSSGTLDWAVSEIPVHFEVVVIVKPLL